MTDADLISLLNRAADALDEEAAWLVDVDLNDRGQERPSIPPRDRPYFDALCEEAQAIRELVETIRARRRAA